MSQLVKTVDWFTFVTLRSGAHWRIQFHGTEFREIGFICSFTHETFSSFVMDFDALIFLWRPLIFHF